MAMAPTKARTMREGRTPFIQLIMSFFLGGMVFSMILVNFHVTSLDHTQNSVPHHQVIATMTALPLASKISLTDAHAHAHKDKDVNKDSQSSIGISTSTSTSTSTSVLDGQRILVAIAAFDFSQIPHLEEVLDAYHDLCVAGSKVDVFIHATVPYPVTLIDLLNTRHQCTNPSPKAGFSITVVLVSPRVRLHLVDFHRPMFYEKLQHYDLFIYSEDDIRVTPHTVSTYLTETQRVQNIVGHQHAAEYNVGIARYEYNYPPDLVIDDKTRGATSNVTRVYWEHSWHPAIPKSVDAVPQALLKNEFVHMKNHHQGMFIATQGLLKAWRDKPGCEFDKVRDRPGLKNKPSQPAEGTQRVWMSSQMLYGNRHCNVQQVIPIDKFGALTVLHLPNKNYRRVGKKGRLGGKDSDVEVVPDGSENFAPTSPLLLTAMQLHIEIQQKLGTGKPQIPYKGIRMIDQVDQARSKLLEQRMKEYHAYVERGGVLSEDDMEKTDLYAV